MREIPLTQGQVALVDDEDFRAASSVNWHAQRCSNCWAVVRWMKNAKKRTQESLGQFLLPGRPNVIHRNGNGLDCRRSNLAGGTDANRQQCRGRFKNNVSGLKGVYWEVREEKFRAQIRVAGKKICLGRFASALDAAVAYDDAATKYFGEFARTNFPSAVDSPAAQQRFWITMKEKIKLLLSWIFCPRRLT